MKKTTGYLNIILYATLAICVTAVVDHGNSATLVDPSGTWLTEDGRARVRIERCGAKQERVCGYIVWMEKPVDAKGRTLLDENNPNPAKKSRPLLGHQLIMGLQPSTEWHFQGPIYNAENGQSYEISLWRETTNKLKVKGCMLSVLCSTQTWAQANDVLSGQLQGTTGEADGPKSDKEWAQLISSKPASPTKAGATH